MADICGRWWLEAFSKPQKGNPYVRLTAPAIGKAPAELSQALADPVLPVTVPWSPSSLGRFSSSASQILPKYDFGNFH